MDKAILAAHEIDEGAEIHGFHHFSRIQRADLGFGGDTADPFDGAIGGILVDRRHLDRAVVFEVDLGAGDLADFTDHLAARADDLADLVLGDGDDGDPRGVVADAVAGILKGLAHLAEDVHAPLAGLLQRHAHDVFGDRRDLDVHLQRGDAPLRAGHLEVHVPEVVLVA